MKSMMVWSSLAASVTAEICGKREAMRQYKARRAARRYHVPMSKRPLFIILVLAFAVAGLFAGLKVFHAAPTPQVQTRAVQLFPQPRPIPAFSLQRGDGSALTPETLRGHWTLVF